MHKAPGLKIFFALLSIYLIWGSTYLGIKYAIATIPPLLMSGFRYLGASMLFLVILTIKKPSRPCQKEFWNAFLIGALLMTGGTGIMAISQQSVSTGVASIGIAAVPLWACLFSTWFGSKPNKQELFGLALGFLGILILNSEKTVHAEWLGALLLFVAPISWAFGSMLSRKIAMPKDILMSTTIQFIGGAFCTLALGLLVGERITQTPSITSLLGTLYLIIFGSFIGYTIYQHLLTQVRPALATSYAFVNPIVAILLGTVIAKEQLTTTIIIALCIVTTGVAAVVLGQQKRALSSKN